MAPRPSSARPLLTAAASRWAGGGGGRAGAGVQCPSAGGPGAGAPLALRASSAWCRALATLGVTSMMFNSRIWHSGAPRWSSAARAKASPLPRAQVVPPMPPSCGIRAQPWKGSLRLYVQCIDEEVRDMYRNHGHYHPGDSGIDLFVVRDQEIKAGETAFIKLGIRCSPWAVDPDGDEGAEGSLARPASWLLMPRSSIAKTPLRLCNSVGLIDAGYRGEVMTAVDNVKSYDYVVKKGDRLVQGVAFDGGPIHVELVDTLDATERGEGGFGSTTVTAGVKNNARKIMSATGN